jgi:protein-tyrosine phosphatase
MPRARDRRARAGRGAPEAGEQADVRLLFVCLGNICRSPTAEGVMRALVRDAGLEDQIELDSAGLGSWHVGSRPDGRAAAAARARGIALNGRARTVTRDDFDDFDLLLAMDRSNLRELRRMAPDGRGRAKVRLLREFDPASPSSGGEPRASGDLDVRDRDPEVPEPDLDVPDPDLDVPDPDLEVPDPYYGAAGGFEEVLDLVQAACAGLLEEVRPRGRT